MGHLGLLAAVAVSGCRQSPEISSAIDYGNAAPVGKWGPEQGGDGATTDQIAPMNGADGMAGMRPVSAGASGISGDTGASGARAGAAGSVAPGGHGGSTSSNMGPLMMGSPNTGGEMGQLMFSVLTLSQGGRFAPKNIGAIWIEDASGAFVETLAVWAATRARYLSKFNAEAGANRVDAVTSATLRTHTVHNVTWNLSMAQGGTAPHGSYKIFVEVTDHDGTGNWTSVDFSLDGKPFSMMSPDQQYFTGMQVSYQ